MAVSRRLPPRVPFLLVCDQEYLSELENVSVFLPLCAYGRVFVELDSPKEMWPLQVPTWMTLNWFFRRDYYCGFDQVATRPLKDWPAQIEPCRGQEHVSRRLRTGACSAYPGLVAVKAARAWSDEVLCDPEVAAQARVWLGLEPSLAERFQSYLTESLGVYHENVLRPGGEHCLKVF